MLVISYDTLLAPRRKLFPRDDTEAIWLELNSTASLDESLIVALHFFVPVPGGVSEDALNLAELFPSFSGTF